MYLYYNINEKYRQFSDIRKYGVRILNMANSLIKNGQIFLQRLDRQENICRNFLLAPADPQSRLGTVFGIIEINSTDKNNYFFIDEIISEIEMDFSNVEEFYGRRDAAINSSAIFEKALQKVNARIAKLIKNKRFKTDLQKINSIIAMIFPPSDERESFELLFSYAGKINSFLIHNSEDRARTINIISKTQSPAKARPNPLRLFSHIISGDIQAEDSIFICNENVLDYISIDNIKKIITALPAASAAQQVQNNLAMTNKEKTFAGITIKLIAPAEAAEEIAREPEKDSIQRLYENRQNTDQLLTPSLNIKGKSEAILKKITGVLSKDILKKIFSFIFSSIRSLIKRSKKQMPSASPDIEDAQAEYVEGENEVSEAPDEELSSKVGIFERLLRLPKLSKSILVVAIVFMVSFILSISIIQKKKEQEKKRVAYAQVLGEIEQRQDEAEASIIYNDREGARSLLKEIDAMIGKLTAENAEQQQEVEALSAKNKSIYDKLRKVIDITEPILLTNFNRLAEENAAADSQFSQIFMNDKILYSFDEHNSDIYKFNTESHASEKIEPTFLNIGAFKKAFSTEKSILIYHDNPGLLKMSLSDEKLESIEFDEAADPTDIKEYSGNIYILDPSENKIHKHIALNSGYSSAREWLAEGTDVSDGVAMFIDGYIYILKNNGQISKLLKGRESSKILTETADPPLENLDNSSKLFISEETKDIYILDPQRNRLVVFDGTGKLLAQYYSENFNNLRDFIVNESEKTIYILNGSSVYGIIASHLN